MNTGALEKIADAVMYEGYVLYPYRQSAVKNRQRFNFGVLYPREYCDLQGGSEAWEMTTECLLTCDPLAPIENAAIEIKLRFLQLTQQDNWQEGHPREVFIPPWPLEYLGWRSFRHRFTFPAAEQTLDGELELSAARLDQGIYRATLCVRNPGALQGREGIDRDQALLRAFVSVHSVLHAVKAEFVSLLDPPEPLRPAAAACRNIGAWPVLAGEPGQRDLMLVTPIILYDYPQIAPESAGDLCDGTEIDEILALRILTLTDEEKAEVRNGDARARRILEQMETLPPEHFRKLHGAMRKPHPEREETP